MSEGDLHTALPHPKEPAEIATLATALEESRVSIQRMLDELTEAKTWSETLISSIVEGVMTFDTQGIITFFSEGAARITGFEAASVLGQPLEAIFHLSDNGGEKFLDGIPPRGEMRRLEIIGADGRPIIISMTGARMAPPGSDTVQVALVFRDVTEEEAARNLRSQFLANITHEFRTPLAALNASLELLIDEADRMDAPAIHTLAGSLRLSVVYLQTLIDNLLESSSIEAGRFSIRRKTMELNQVLSHAVQVIEPLLTRRQQTLAISEPTRLAPIHADPTRLGQVLVNLLSNASKYSPPGSTIDLRVEASDASLRIAVLDRGPGIPEVERQNLFRRFVRLDRPEAEQYGIGLGLSVAKVIIEGHSGTIGVDERSGGGSEFWFTLPMEKHDEGIGD
jgi:PAS domain S-box-containing protein